MKMYWVDVRYAKVCAFDVSNYLVKGKVLIEADNMLAANIKAANMYDNFSLNKIFNYESFKKDIVRK